MIPAPIKRFYLSQSFGILLCALALFLVADTFYLNSVRDQKAETVDTITQDIENYQLQNTQAHQSETSLPSSLKQFFPYGKLMQDSLEMIGTQAKDSQVTGIRLDDTTQTEPQEVQTDLEKHHSDRRSKQSQVAERSKTLVISGTIQPHPSTSTDPYAQLNQAISEIRKNTGCQFSLQNANSQDKNHAQNQDGLTVSFSLSMSPLSQKECVQKFKSGQSENGK